MLNKDKYRIKLIKVKLSLPHNSYSDAPQAHPNLILGTLQLAVWIFFHPTAWQNHVKRIDENLRPDFSLAELKRSHWRHPGLRRLLIQAYVILPVIIALLSLLWSWGAPWDFLPSTALSTLTYTILVGVTASVAIGIGANLAFGLVSPLMKMVCLNFLYFINSEVASNFGSVANNAVSVGVTYGLIGSIALYLSKGTTTVSLKKRVKGIAAGALSFLLLNLANGGIYQLGQANFQSNSILGLVIVIAIISCLRSIFLGVAVGWELKNWRRGVVFGIALAFFLAWMSIMGLAGNSIQVNEFLAIVYRIALSMSAAAIPAIAFALPFVVGRSIGGASAGVGAFVLCGILQQVLGLTINWLILLTISIAIGLGITQTKWRSLLLYPLMVIWNFLSTSNLRLNSAFWDEFQWLPLLGLEEQLVVTGEKKPREAHSAIAYLLNTPQKEAARSAKIELTLRDLENCNDIEAIARAHRQYNLDEFTGETPVCIEKLCAISRQVEVVLDGDGRSGLNEVVESLQSLKREMDAKGDRLALRCQTIVNSWQQILTGS